MALNEHFGAPAQVGDPAASESGRRVGNTVVSLGSILAALGAASCCVIPFALATLGVSGAWIGNFAALAPYQPYFVVATIALLAGGFYLVYRKPKAACVEGSYCARPSSGRTARIALWSAMILFVAAIAFPYAAPLL
jgi:mercuric ion transport protein